jgi:crotonobetainyl-CoA:carnitine CoA-transferase CaiB-like acyl-CoA transferase
MASDVEVLHGIRVVEMTVWVAGPSAGGIMADWGADVIKVEPPAGDPQRNIYAALGYRDDLPNPTFGLDNRGKRSVVLDLREDKGREAMEQLLGTADVFLTNMRPAALEKLGLDADQVTARHPKLVYTTITGYGFGGEESWRPGYDIGAFWARSGLARNMAPREAPPAGLRSGIGDHTTGITALAGTMGALVERGRTGKGRVVEASLLRTGVYVNGWDTTTQLNFGRLESSKPRQNAPIPLVNSYEAGDGRWFWLIGLEADRHFPGLLTAIDRTDLAQDERFATAKARKANNKAFIAELDEVFASQPLDYWAERFDSHDVWWAPAQSMAEVVEDPQLHAVGAFITVESPGGEPTHSVNSPITFRGSPLKVSRPAPTLGQHTEEVLAELGLEP